MSKLLTLLFFALIIAGIVGFVYLSVVDVEVPQEIVVEKTTLYDLQQGDEE